METQGESALGIAADLQAKEREVARRRPDEQASEQQLDGERDYEQPYRHLRKDNEAARRYHR